MKTYMIKQIFGPTIQGEGSASGTVVCFVRFTGCNQWDGRPETKAASSCPFCDTDFRGGARMTAGEIVARVKLLSKNVVDVVLSGGEPALQADEALVSEFQLNGYTVHIEIIGHGHAV